jgi:hypothetical protein
MAIGIDIGRVIIAGDTDTPNLFFSKSYLTAPAVDSAFEKMMADTRVLGHEAQK